MPITPATPTQNEWVDDNGRFIFGKYKSKLIDTIARDDPGYLHWVLEHVTNISNEDTRILRATLELRR